ncbi:hypothetical protein [Streptomyces sp. NPDC045470]|uniref:hypothetical protein n=1 Tax=Streptomyces sp. NPDC045470 TaxID=3155469 RepID=UPI0033DEB544
MNQLEADAGTPACEVRQEAGPKYDDLGARIRTIAAEVAPVVEAVTGLPLPPRPLIRVVTPSALARTWLAHLHGLAHRERIAVARVGFTIDAQQCAAWHTDYIDAAKDMVRRWADDAAHSMEDALMRPQVLMKAKVITHAQHDDDQLYRTVAHELTHLAQHRASQGLAWVAAMTRYARTVKVPGHGFVPIAAMKLIEGHAFWAEEEVNLKVLGRKVGWPQAEGTEIFRRAKDRHGVFRNRNGEAPSAAEAKAIYDECHRFVQKAIDRVGLDQFNGIWTSFVSKCPVEDEIVAPGIWQRRVGLASVSRRPATWRQAAFLRRR